MAYFIFVNNQIYIPGNIYNIAENKNDLDNLNVFGYNYDGKEPLYKIIEESQSNFDLFKYGKLEIVSYTDTNITFTNSNTKFDTEKKLINYITNFKNLINDFINSNNNHPQLQRWIDYRSQLSNLNTNSITYPLNKSLEEYFKDLGQPSFHFTQIP